MYNYPQISSQDYEVLAAISSYFFAQASRGRRSFAAVNKFTIAKTVDPFIASAARKRAAAVCASSKRHVGVRDFTELKPIDSERICARVSEAKLALVSKTTLLRTAHNPRPVRVCLQTQQGRN